MIYRVDGTVIPQTADECQHMLCVNELPNDWRVSGEYLISPDADYAHYHRQDCAFAGLCPHHTYIDYNGDEGINYHEYECPIRDILIRAHLNAGGTLAELGID